MNKQELRQAVSLLRMAGQSIIEYTSTIEVGDESDECLDYADEIRIAVENLDQIIRDIDSKWLKS